METKYYNRTSYARLVESRKFLMPAGKIRSTNLFTHEIHQIMHPRVSAIASQINLHNYISPEGDETCEELAKQVAEAAKKDILDACRIFHPDPNFKHVYDGDEDIVEDGPGIDVDDAIRNLKLRCKHY